MKNKLTLALTIIAIISLCGCQQMKEQATNLRSQADKIAKDTANNINSAKASVIDAKAQIDNKVKQVKNASDSINAVLNK